MLASMQARTALVGMLLLACGGRTAREQTSRSVAEAGSRSVAEAGSSSVGEGGSSSAGSGSGTVSPTRGCLTRVSASSVAVCAIRRDGALFCWGNNARGQAGPARESPAHVTRIEALGTNVVAVARGAEFTCALDRQHRVWCWGGNNFGQLGNGDSIYDARTPQLTLPIDGDVVALAPGGTHMCVRTAERDAWCWGNNGWGELGLDFVSRDAPATPTPQLVPALRGQVELLAGAEVQSCAAGGATTWCWGGRDDNAGAGVPEPTVVAWGGVPEELSMSYGQSCALHAGRVTCWNSNYQVHPERYELQNVALPEAMHGLAVGPRHACALAPSRDLYCWGDNDLAQLGRETAQGRLNPAGRVTRVPGPFSSVSVGDDFTCAIDDEAELWCWGDNTFGQIEYVEASHDNVITQPVRIDIPCD
jgi:alpha-tubulin suppressor-like RCC1 family protein